MKNKKSKIIALISMILVAIMIFSACSCNGNPNEVLYQVAESGDGATLKMSVLYTDAETRMTLSSGIGTYISKADGVRYQTNDWKPTWKALQNKLNFTIDDVTPDKASSVSNAFDLLQATKFNNVHVLSGTVSSIVDEATKNKSFVDLAKYKEYLPDFFNFLEQNEIVKKSITSADGEIFYAPYFDGFDDTETMFLCRVDWIEKLLDDDFETYRYAPGTQNETGWVVGDQMSYDTARLLSSGSGEAHYKGFYDSVDTKFTAVKGDGSGTQEVSLKYNSGEGIIAKQNALSVKNGKNLTETLKQYIVENYITPGYISKPSELFAGQNACYNADELIALWRCVYTNPKLLAGNENAQITPFYPRGYTYDRANQVLQLAQLWGVRGYESRNGYLYLDKDGVLQDSRVSPDMMEALDFIHQIYKEGLILKEYTKGDDKSDDHRQHQNGQNTGFMTYDYNQTTSIYNITLKGSEVQYRNISPILFPVADWDNTAEKVAGKDSYSVKTDTLYQYTESWRSVKTEGWSITTLAAKDPKVFRKALDMFNYMYTEEGQRLMTYGPDDFIEFKDGVMQTIEYKGRQVPKIKAEVLDELRDMNIGKGNYTNYYRYYVGSTLPLGFVKEQGMEYQTVDQKGAVGLNYINTAVDLGVIKHASVTKDPNNPQNSLIPTTFPLSQQQVNGIGTQCAILNSNFNNSAAAGSNVFHSYVFNGFDTDTTKSKEDLIKQINEEWKLTYYLTIYRGIYNNMYK